MLPRKRRPPLPKNPLVARLLDPQQVVVFDGAMGTMLYNKGVFINQCYDELNLRAPDLVRDVHKDYKKAGAEVLETNSFGANRLKLEQYGLSADNHTPCGLYVEDMSRAHDTFGDDVIGLNCSVGPQIILYAIDKIAPKTRRKLSAQPNAGMPSYVCVRSMYMASPEDMAKYA